MPTFLLRGTFAMMAPLRRGCLILAWLSDFALEVATASHSCSAQRAESVPHLSPLTAAGCAWFARLCGHAVGHAAPRCGHVHASGWTLPCLRAGCAERVMLAMSGWADSAWLLHATRGGVSDAVACVCECVIRLYSLMCV
mmetsp:Transcript_43251/g.113624  ORF Transcript_43251/g.113624 Transcript_43251/m.113624 type:complete len:140 (+) Transcript_43251:1159-1578(+)